MLSEIRGTTLQRCTILSIVGLVVSLYLVKDHHDAKGSICDFSKTFSCSVINQSVYSELFNVPIAVFGVCWFIVLNGMHVKIKELDKNHALWIWSQFYWLLIGVFYCFYLIWAEFQLGSICPFCTIVHIITFIEFYLTINLLREEFRVIQPSMKQIVNIVSKLHLWIFAAIILFTLPVIVYNTTNLGAKPKSMPITSIKNLGAFVNCVENNAIMYGDDSCPHCQHQKKIFGTFMTKLRYVRCESEPDACNDRKIEGMPTWIRVDHSGVELSRHVGVMELPELSEWIGCPLEE